MTTSSDPAAALRDAVDQAPGRMVVVPRAALAAVLEGRATTRGVFLTAADAERLAEAAWVTATDPDYVARYGPWGSNRTDHARHQVEAARRAITQLIEWVESGR